MVDSAITSGDVPCALRTPLSSSVGSLVDEITCVPPPPAKPKNDHKPPGHVTGLYPGATRPLRVKITNTYAFAIRVATPTGKAAAKTTKAGCTGAPANLGLISTSTRRLVIPAHKSKTVVLQVTMPTTVANACQGATFKLSLRARATRA